MISAQKASLTRTQWRRTTRSGSTRARGWRSRPRQPKAGTTTPRVIFPKLVVYFSQSDFDICVAGTGTRRASRRARTTRGTCPSWTRQPRRRGSSRRPTAIWTSPRRTACPRWGWFSRLPCYVFCVWMLNSKMQNSWVGRSTEGDRIKYIWE